MYKRKAWELRNPSKHRIGLVLLFASGLPPAAASGPADVVLTEARIYTADPGRTMAEALAIKAGQIVFVGRSSDARALAGPSTRVKSLGGRLVLPGLVDAHIHPLDIADLDVCDLDSKPLSLRHLETLWRIPLHQRWTGFARALRRIKPDVVNSHLCAWDRFPTVVSACEAGRAMVSFGTPACKIS